MKKPSSLQRSDSPGAALYRHVWRHANTALALALGFLHGRTVAINGSRPTGNHHPRRCPRVHLHRVVPGVPFRWSRPPTSHREILPGHQGRTPPRLARCSRLRGRLTRATTDSHREARPARAASGASTLHQPLRPFRAGLPLGPSPHDAAPTPSLSQWRSELRRPDGGREGLASFVGARIARNGEADLRRTIRSATPLGVGRRLIQRLVPHALSTMGGLATPPTEILPRYRDRTPQRPAR